MSSNIIAEASRTTVLTTVCSRVVARTQVAAVGRRPRCETCQQMTTQKHRCEWKMIEFLLPTGWGALSDTPYQQAGGHMHGSMAARAETQLSEDDGLSLNSSEPAAASGSRMRRSARSSSKLQPALTGLQFLLPLVGALRGCSRTCRSKVSSKCSAATFLLL